MMKSEFEARIGKRISDAEYEVVEFVYQYHPAIKNITGKDDVAELYTRFGVGIFREMSCMANRAMELERKVSCCKAELEKLMEEARILAAEYTSNC